MLRSTNERLNRVFDGSGYLNIEATVPIGFETAYESPVLDISREAKAAIVEGMRFIVPEETLGKVGRAAKKSVRVMTSTLECGRVVEADQQIDLNGEKYVITFKGAGATTYVEWMLRNRIKLGERKEVISVWKDWLSILKKQRYVRDIRGLMDEKEAIAEKEISESYERIGISMQTVLGIYRIFDLPNARGGTTEVTTLREIGVLPRQASPVILVRAMRSNLRILDMLNLKTTQKKKNLELLYAELACEHGSLRDYFLTTVGEIVRNHTISMIVGKEIISKDSIIHARNISIHGEEIDFETIHFKDRDQNLPFSTVQSWPGVIRILYYLLVTEDKKFDFTSQQLDELVECIIWQTLLETGQNRSSIDKLQKGLWNAWKYNENSDSDNIREYVPLVTDFTGKKLDYERKSARIRSSKTVGRHGKVVP